MLKVVIKLLWTLQGGSDQRQAAVLSLEQFSAVLELIESVFGEKAKDSVRSTAIRVEKNTWRFGQATQSLETALGLPAGSVQL